MKNKYTTTDKVLAFSNLNNTINLFKSLKKK